MELSLQHNLSASVSISLQNPPHLRQLLWPNLFSQTVLGLTLVLCIVFIADVFPWLYVERFQSTEVKQFCPDLELSKEVLKLLSVMLQMQFFTYGIKINAQNIFAWYSTQMLKISNSFLRKYYEIAWKFQNKKCSNR